MKTHELQLSRAYRAVHQIPLWPEFRFTAIATREDREFLNRMGSVLGASMLCAAAHEAILAERAFLSGATSEEIDAMYEVAA
ncbi:MAG: hypothetical protein JNJ45_05430 [Chthonomonas sp.]|nr:hypothetical protein [Chthonomonas sp.]